MQLDIVVLRLLHIGFGVFWVGSALFLVLILEPRLRALGPTIQRPVMGALARVMGPALGVSGLITIAAGLTLFFQLPRGGLDRLFADAWAWAIFIGFLATVLAYGAGLVLGITTNRLAGLGKSIEGRPPTPEEGGQLQRLSARAVLMGRLVAGLAVGAMASARFV